MERSTIVESAVAALVRAGPADVHADAHPASMLHASSSPYPLVRILSPVVVTRPRYGAAAPVATAIRMPIYRYERFVKGWVGADSTLVTAGGGASCPAQRVSIGTAGLSCGGRWRATTRPAAEFDRRTSLVIGTAGTGDPLNLMDPGVEVGMSNLVRNQGFSAGRTLNLVSAFAGFHTGCILQVHTPVNGRTAKSALMHDGLPCLASDIRARSLPEEVDDVVLRSLSRRSPVMPSLQSPRDPARIPVG